jgi:GNAT superfamily N-acetyltransferase
MNFYSDEIINEIIDDAPLESMIDTLDTFKEKVRSYLHRFSGKDIHCKYVDSLLGEEKNKVVFYCMDFEFSIDNCPVIMIYRKDKSKYKVQEKEKQETRYYILMLCTKPTFRNQGYASKLLDGFLEKIRKEQRIEQEKKTKIILSSVETAVLFYEAYGFRWTTDTLSDHRILMMAEKKEDDKEYFIMEMVV